MLWPKLAPFVLLGFSNIFMTLVWYGHLKFKASHIGLAILASWAIALLEYSLAVPANRIGSAAYSLAELKVIQEVIAITVFILYAMLAAGETIRPGQLAGFALIALGAGLVFRG